MSHLPAWSGAVSWMWPIIQAGQARTANWSFLKPWSQLGWKLARLAERPASIAFMLTSIGQRGYLDIRRRQGGVEDLRLGLKTLLQPEVELVEPKVVQVPDMRDLPE